MIFVYWLEKDNSIRFIVLAEIQFILESLDAVTPKVHFTADIQYEIKYYWISPNKLRCMLALSANLLSTTGSLLLANRILRLI